MFGEEREVPKNPTIPTIRQYAKTCGEGIIGKTKFQVGIVWLPGQFNNVTLQTHAFRLVIDENDPSFDSYKEHFGGIKTKTTCPRLDVTITNLEPLRYKVSENPKTKGSWEKLGKNGLKFTDP